ncbi:MAG TPA: serine/threonine-protein kinase, partial [Kofleriaceae bacterium]|nr:serine/threonine-protein kinase [Kofleriaceae bacterium]
MATPGTRYRLGAELGRGGMGRVVEALDTQLDRVVALKEVLPTGGASDARRFAREVRITARLEHPSIVPLYDAGTTADGRPYYTMRRVSGRPLDQVLADEKQLSQRLARLPNLLAACDAVAHAHRRGIIHRDLKPTNILVGELGETVVIDWGLAKVVGEVETPSEDPRAPAASDSLHTQAGSVFGTPGFMPPEQARGDELGPRSDVFALGATLYHLLAGRPPVTGRSATEVLEATFRHALVPIARACPEAPPELVAIVDKALAPEPAGRYADAAALAEDVRRFLTGQLVAAHRYTRRQRLARFVRRNRAVLAVGVVAVMTLGVLATLGVRRIVAERDAAHAAEATAQQEQHEADVARREAEKQRDAQLVAHAEALLETDPTKAAALLADLPPHSDMLEDARAIAQAAQVRGVAFGIATLAGTAIGNALSPDARYFAQTTLEGDFAIYDLDTRKR